MKVRASRDLGDVHFKKQIYFVMMNSVFQNSTVNERIDMILQEVHFAKENSPSIMAQTIENA